MEKETLKSWLRLAVIIVCGMVALVLVMAEPNECGSMVKWFGVFVASKLGAIACGWIAYQQLNEITKEIKTNK